VVRDFWDTLYIGQFRLDEHNPVTNSNQQSDVTKQLLKNPTHYINFNEPESLYLQRKRITH